MLRLETILTPGANKPDIDSWLKNQRPYSGAARESSSQASSIP